MNLLKALKSKKAKCGSWKNMYDTVARKINKVKVKEDDKTNWYDLCMNDYICQMILPNLVRRQILILFHLDNRILLIMKKSRTEVKEKKIMKMGNLK